MRCVGLVLVLLLVSVVSGASDINNDGLSDDQTTAEDVKHEIERVTGVDVVVVMTEKGKFEVTVVGGDAIDVTDLAKKLEAVRRDGTPDLLRRIKTVDLRIDALSGDITAIINHLLLLTTMITATLA
jgi:hypothetical protein